MSHYQKRDILNHLSLFPGGEKTANIFTENLKTFNEWLNGGTPFDLGKTIKASLDEQDPLAWSMLSFFIRESFVAAHGFSLPRPGFEKRINSLGPTLEIAAGTGYLSTLLNNHGGDCISTDIEPWNNPFDVKTMDAKKAVETYPNRILLISWPGMGETWINDILLSMPSGQHFVLIGEGIGGCTGNDEMWPILDNHFIDQTTPEDDTLIWRWPGIHDRLSIWKKK